MATPTWHKTSSWNLALFVMVFASMVHAPPAMAVTSGLELGTVSLKSIGPMTFARDGVLLIGDPKTATIYAIDTEDTSGTKAPIAPIENVAAAISSTLQSGGKVSVGELAVNSDTGNVFLTVKSDDQVRLIKIDGENTISEVNLDKVAHAAKTLPNAPEDKDIIRRGRNRNARLSSITDLAYFDGKVMVTGLSGDDSPSRVLEMPFPFADNSVTTSVEFFHAAHGRVEEQAPIQTFLPMVIDGEPNLLAGFTCTPLVRFPVDQLQGGSKVRGATIAELGNRNTPLDMVVYERDGKTSVLMTNTARGTMKISTENMGDQESLSQKVSGGGTAGQAFESIKSLDTIVQMDKLSDRHAIALVTEGETLTLKAIELP